MPFCLLWCLKLKQRKNTCQYATYSQDLGTNQLVLSTDLSFNYNNNNHNKTSWKIFLKVHKNVGENTSKFRSALKYLQCPWILFLPSSSFIDFFVCFFHNRFRLQFARVLIDTDFWSDFQRNTKTSKTIWIFFTNEFARYKLFASTLQPGSDKTDQIFSGCYSL